VVMVVFRSKVRYTQSWVWLGFQAVQHASFQKLINIDLPASEFLILAVEWERVKSTKMLGVKILPFLSLQQRG